MLSAQGLASNEKQGLCSGTLVKLVSKHHTLFEEISQQLGEETEKESENTSGKHSSVPALGFDFYLLSDFGLQPVRLNIPDEPSPLAKAQPLYLSSRNFRI
ncbi:MAG TPA: hypothetical protein PLQ93_12555 [Bacteroidia bacterium]|nr:hypothetical protein [Bacteroidia bacterium]